MIKKIIVLLFLTLFCCLGCGGSDTLKIGEHESKKTDCAIPVIDERTEKRLIIEQDGTSDVFDLPPIQETLFNQVCQSQAIKKYSETNKNFKIIIKDMNATLVPYSYESELTIVLIGYIQDGDKKGGIRSATTKDTKEVTVSLIKDLVDQNITDFTSKIENYVRQSSQ